MMTLGVSAAVSLSVFFTLALCISPQRTPSKEESKVSMAKLMEHGYIREWQDDRNRWYEKQQKVSDCFDDVTQQRQEKLEQESMELHQAAANTNQNARLK